MLPFGGGLYCVPDAIANFDFSALRWLVRDFASAQGRKPEVSSQRGSGGKKMLKPRVSEIFGSVHVSRLRICADFEQESKL